MNETWLEELNKRKLYKRELGCSQWDCATVFAECSVLNKASKSEQVKFEITFFKRPMNQI